MNCIEDNMLVFSLSYSVPWFVIEIKQYVCDQSTILTSLSDNLNTISKNRHDPHNLMNGNYDDWHVLMKCVVL